MQLSESLLVQIFFEERYETFGFHANQKEQPGRQDHNEYQETAILNMDFNRRKARMAIRSVILSTL